MSDSHSAPHTSPDRSVPPAAGDLRPFHLPAPAATRLDSGLEIRVLPQGRVPLVSGCLVLDSGETAVPGKNAGLAVFTGDALLGGTEVRDGAALSEALEELGTSLSVSAGWDATTLAFTCAAERLESTLELLAEVVLRPAFPQDEVERVRRQRLAAIEQRGKDPGDRADDEADRILFPTDHPYHRPLGGMRETVPELGGDHARGWVAARYRPGGAGLVLVGDLDPAEADDFVAAGFEAWDGGPPERHGLPPVSPPEPRPIVVVHRPGAVQSELRILQPSPPRAHEDHLALQVGNSILGGSFTSRLNLSLREDHGFTYGVHSRFVTRRPGGVFTISTAVGTEVTVDAVGEAMHVFNDFVAKGPTAEEVARARDYLAGIFPLRMETTAQLAARTAEILIYDLPDDEYQSYRERIRGVTPEMVATAVGTHLTPATAPIVLTADADAVVPGLEALGLGTVEVRE